MRNVRRLYFYLVTFISLEMVIWGAVSLAQTILNAPVTGIANNLASGLSLVLVGVPIFLLHGAVVQRDARRDPEERANRLRAIFFFGVRLATQVPAVQSGLSIAARLVQGALGLPAGTSFLNLDQTYTDALVVVVFNLVAWAYFSRLLRQEEQALPAASPLGEVRRLYRYVWMIYTLGLTLYGTASIVWYILYIPRPLDVYPAGRAALVDGVALVALGAPLWALAWRSIQRSLSDPGEMRSMLRLVALYGLTLVAAIVVVTAGINAASGVLRIVLGEGLDLPAYLEAYRTALAALLPFGIVWAFFYRPLRLEWAVEADELRRAALVRLYNTLMAAIGNGTVFIGAWLLLNALADIGLAPVIFASGLRNQVSGATAALAVGIPLWVFFWLRLQVEARRPDDLGDHARRSVLRKAYLYLVIFLAVIGSMTNAGVLIYDLVKSGLGSPLPDLLNLVVHALAQLALCAVWLAYHLAALRQDGSLAQQALSARRAAFPVLVLQMGDSAFFGELVSTLSAQAPGLPVTFYKIGAGLPWPQPESVQAVVLSASLAASAGEEAAAWLRSCSARRLVVPLPDEGWVWLGTQLKPSNVLARETAQALRQLAEGEPVKPPPPNNAWVIAGYVFGGLFALEVVLVGFIAIMSMISR